MGKAEILRECSEGPVLWALGAECGIAEQTAELLRQRGIKTTLINARFAAPFDRETALRFSNRLQVVIEDHAGGGLGSALSECCAAVPGGEVLLFNWGSSSVGHGNVAELRRERGLDPESIAGRIAEQYNAFCSKS